MFNLEDALHDIYKLIKFQAKKKGLEISIENKFTSKSECMIYSDSNRIKQIILNLLGNSLKFTEKGFIKIILEPIKSIEEGNTISKQGNNLRRSVKVSVQDTGMGIKKEDIPHLFQFFGKLKNSQSQKANQTGVGLGLAISQNLVKILNNYQSEALISVESVYGHGSLFSFIINPFENNLPSNQKAQATPTRNDTMQLDYTSRTWTEDEIIIIHPPPPMKSKPQLSKIFAQGKLKKNLLLVDDDQINILVLSKFVGLFEDCSFDVAFNGRDAVELVKQKASAGLFYDLIFMDCNMPVMDGFEASTLILEMNREKIIKDVVIVATTANVSPIDHENCFKCGMLDYLTKPFTKNQLREKIDKYS